MNNLACKKKLTEMEKALRETQIRKKHEMGEMKRAQELRVDELSVQKLRESRETIQRLISQLQEMQEHVNSMNDSGEFQEVESNHSGRLSYVRSQPAGNLSSRSVLSCDHLTHGMCLDHRKYDSQELRCVKHVSEIKMDRRLEKYKSKFFISEVPTL